MFSLMQAGPTGRCCAVAQFAFLLTACYSWRTEPVGPRALVETHRPQIIRATFINRSQLTLNEPRIQGDSLYGRIGDVVKEGKPIGVPLAQVEQVEVRHAEAGETSLAVVGGAAGFVLLLGLLRLALTPAD